MSIVGLIKGIVYLTISGKDFYEIYVEEKKGGPKASRINVTISSI